MHAPVFNLAILTTDFWGFFIVAFSLKLVQTAIDYYFFHSTSQDIISILYQLPLRHYIHPSNNTVTRKYQKNYCGH